MRVSPSRCVVNRPTRLRAAGVMTFAYGLIPDASSAFWMLSVRICAGVRFGAVSERGRETRKQPCDPRSSAQAVMAYLIFVSDESRKCYEGDGFSASRAVTAMPME